jgi:hypothetical protein
MGTDAREIRLTFNVLVGAQPVPSIECSRNKLGKQKQVEIKSPVREKKNQHLNSLVLLPDLFFHDTLTCDRLLYKWLEIPKESEPAKHLGVFFNMHTTVVQARKLEHGRVRAWVQIKVREMEHRGRFSDAYSVCTYFKETESTPRNMTWPHNKTLQNVLNTMAAIIWAEVN